MMEARFFASVRQNRQKPETEGKDKGFLSLLQAVRGG